MSDLTGKPVNTTYQGLLQVNTGVGLNTTLHTVQDGKGNSSVLQLSTTTCQLGNISFNGNVVSTTNTNGNINFVPNGSGLVQINGQTIYTHGGGAVSISDGGTGTTTAPSNGQLLIGNAGAYSVANLTAGSNITITNTAGGITIAGTGGIGDPGSNGLLSRTAANIATPRTLTAPSAGLTITNPDGVSGNPTFALANSLSALQTLGTSGTNGIISRTGTDTYTTRSITGTTNQIAIANGDGVSGAPTISLDTAVIFPGTGAVTLPSGTTGQQPSPSNGMVRYNTTTNHFEFRENGSWVNYATSAGTSELVLIGSATASASATIDFTSISNSTYQYYILECSDVQPATTNTILYLRVSNGGVFDTTSANYEGCITFNTTDGTTTTVQNTSSVAAFVLSNNSATAWGNSAYGSYKIIFHNPASTNRRGCNWEGSNTLSSAQVNIVRGGGVYKSASAIDGFRFLFNSGNIASGKFFLYGVKNT